MDGIGSFPRTGPCYRWGLAMPIVVIAASCSLLSWSIRVVLSHVVEGSMWRLLSPPGWEGVLVHRIMRQKVRIPWLVWGGIVIHSWVGLWVLVDPIPRVPLPYATKVWCYHNLWYRICLRFCPITSAVSITLWLLYCFLPTSSLLPAHLLCPLHCGCCIAPPLLPVQI